MKIITKIAILCAVVLSASSCRLDLKPTTVIESGTSFESYDDAEKFANGATAYFRACMYGRYDFTAEIQTDFFNASTEYGNRGGFPHTMSQSFTSGDYDIYDLWRQLYKTISATNNYLTKIAEIEGDFTIEEAEKANVLKGHIYFYRAYCYHKLLRYYSAPFDAATATAAASGVPLITEFDIAERAGRATIAEVYTLINADLAAANTLLTGVSGVVRAELPTIDAVKALQARVALFQKDYATAATLAGELIDGAVYTLATNAAAMEEEWTNDNGTEDIMQLFANLSEYAVSAQGSGSGSASLRMNIYIGYRATNKTFTPDFIPTQTAVDMYEAGDIRFASWFKLTAAVFSSVNSNLYLLNKYPGNPALFVGDSRTYAQKPKVFRIAEMYLIKAEALIATGGDSKTVLNQLQASRGATLTDGSMASVQKEWAKETIGEGFRMDCLKRWGLGFTNRVPQDLDIIVNGTGFNIIDIQPKFGKFISWAIPDNEIQTNATIESQQNPGW